MRLCPVELDYCERSECRQGHCYLSGERLLYACLECGELVAIRGVKICIACIASVKQGED
jgi:hypothetical protein